jgi:hypothetical protein
VALTGFDGDKAVAAMGKTLELDGGKRVLRQYEGGRAHKPAAWQCSPRSSSFVACEPIGPFLDQLSTFRKVSRFAQFLTGTNRN